MLSTKGSFQPEQEQDPLMTQTDVTKTKQEELFQKVSPNIRMLFFPFRFLGFWLGRKFWFEDPNAPKARTLLDDIIYGEGPRFRIQTGELYFTDMHDKKVIKYSLASGERTVVYSDPEDMLSGLGWLPDGRLLISSMNKRRVLVHDEQAKSTGVFGLNNADFKTVASAAIVSVGTDGAVRVEATGVVFPNGMVITPDGKTLIVGETFEGRLTAYDVEGCVWASIVQPGLYQLGGGLVRVKEGGEILDVLGFGANGFTNAVFACQLGTDATGKHQLFFMESVTSYIHVIFKDGPKAARKNGLVRSIEVPVSPARIPGNERYCEGYC